MNLKVNATRIQQLGKCKALNEARKKKKKMEESETLFASGTENN